MILQKLFQYVDLVLKDMSYYLKKYFVEIMIHFVLGFFDDLKVQKNSIYLK